MTEVTAASAPKRKRYSTANQVCERYGGRSKMWLWRKLRNDPKFPRPMEMGKNLRLFDDGELDAYDAALRMSSALDAPEAA
jgi:predicted DNA-binding transcriptional regulator AlpA